jgi:hypothetical protein
VSKWIVNRLVDLLLVFALATLLLWWGASRYPAFFPERFQQHWGAVSPSMMQSQVHR